MGENNKIIAEFMGWEQYPQTPVGYLENSSKDRKLPPYYSQINTKVGKISDFNYNTDWNWLMPVVDKIKDLKIVTNVNYNIAGDFIIEGLTKTKVLNIIINRKDYKSDIEMVYKGIVEFINFYNKEKES